MYIIYICYFNHRIFLNLKFKWPKSEEKILGGGGIPCIVPLVNMNKKNAPPPLFGKLPTPLNIITRAGLNPNRDRS